MSIQPVKILAACAMTVLALNANADHHQKSGGQGHAEHHPKTGDAKAPVFTQGEVRAVNKEKQRITLKHAEIRNLDMAPMTMAFAVKDPAMLDSVKAGDKVEFKAVMENGTATVIEMRAKK